MNFPLCAVRNVQLVVRRFQAALRIFRRPQQRAATLGAVATFLTATLRLNHGGMV